MASKSAQQALRTALKHTAHASAALEAAKTTLPFTVKRKAETAREILRQAGLVTK